MNLALLRGRRLFSAFSYRSRNLPNVQTRFTRAQFILWRVDAE